MGDDPDQPYEAAFHATDAEVVVEATLCCRWCLRCAVGASILQDAEGGEARCVCRHCAGVTTIRLHAAQVLRLAVRPPPGLVVVLS